ncbi:MAG TPA: hypothetical protein VGK66_01060, partial [Solirubrobacterales bacterium]
SPKLSPPCHEMPPWQQPIRWYPVQKQRLESARLVLHHEVASPAQIGDASSDPSVRDPSVPTEENQL